MGNMGESGYNGWSNYETWCVSLWLSNDEGLYNATRELVGSLREEHEGAPNEEVSWDLGLALRGLCETFPEVEAVQSQASFVADLFGSAWSEVDWREIAANLLSEVDA
jgi:hypothetical protein